MLRRVLIPCSSGLRLDGLLLALARGLARGGLNPLFFRAEVGRCLGKPLAVIVMDRES